jgi:hypothetical protein
MKNKRVEIADTMSYRSNVLSLSGSVTKSGFQQPLNKKMDTLVRNNRNNIFVKNLIKIMKKKPEFMQIK